MSQRDEENDDDDSYYNDISAGYKVDTNKLRQRHNSQNEDIGLPVRRHTPSPKHKTNSNSEQNKQRQTTTTNKVKSKEQNKHNYCDYLTKYCGKLSKKKIIFIFIALVFLLIGVFYGPHCYDIGRELLASLNFTRREWGYAADITPDEFAEKSKTRGTALTEEALAKLAGQLQAENIKMDGDAQASAVTADYFLQQAKFDLLLCYQYDGWTSWNLQNAESSVRSVTKLRGGSSTSARDLVKSVFGFEHKLEKGSSRIDLNTASNLLEFEIKVNMQELMASGKYGSYHTVKKVDSSTYRKKRDDTFMYFEICTFEKLPHLMIGTSEASELTELIGKKKETNWMYSWQLDGAGGAWTIKATQSRTGDESPSKLLFLAERNVMHMETRLITAVKEHWEQLKTDFKIIDYTLTTSKEMEKDAASDRYTKTFEIQWRDSFKLEFVYKNPIVKEHDEGNRVYFIWNLVPSPSDGIFQERFKIENPARIVQYHFTAAGGHLSSEHLDAELHVPAFEAKFKSHFGYGKVLRHCDIKTAIIMEHWLCRVTVSFEVRQK